MKPKINWKNPEEVKAYQKAHNQMPEVKSRKKIERDKPENKTKIKKYQEEYNKRPEVILRKKEKDTPENREALKLCSKKNYQKNKDKIKIKRDKPENKLKLKLYMEKWQEENKDYLKIYKNKPENKARIKELQQKARLNKLYNLTIEDYNKMVKQQNNKCAICGKEEINTFKGKIVNLSVDHNQKTGKVRELLCKDCNVSLGNLKEDISLFYKCIEYLKQYKKDDN